jgi:putative transposase
MRSFKTKINPNNKQRTSFLKHAGTARHAWNWGLNVCINSIHETGATPSAIDLHKLLVKEVKPDKPWYYESSKCSPQEALRNLIEAFSRFWKQHKINKTKPFHKKYLAKYIRQFQHGKIKTLSIEHEYGFPKKKKKGIHDGFYLEGNFEIDWVNANRIKVPKIGLIKTYEKLPQGIEIKNSTITRTADDWFVAFKIGKAEITKHKNNKSVGVDLGVKTLATMSNFQTIQSPKPYKTQKNKLQRIQRKMSRQKKDQYKLDKKECSKNYIKTRKKFAKLHQKISNIRKDTTHKLTSYLVKNHNRIVIEDLNVSGMVKNHNLASAILDGGFYEFKRQLQYKCKWNSVELVIADRWFASSQLCSDCGHRQKMPLKQRIFKCEDCNLELDRDLNAAINLRNYVPQANGEKVCGDAKFHANWQVGISETEIRQQATE